MSKSIPTKVGSAARLALAASAIGQFLALPALLAQAPQDPSSPDVTEMGPMVITGGTGTQIPISDVVGLVPVDVFSQVEIQKLGATTISEVVRRLPSAVGAGNFNESRGNGGDGSAQVNLRGLAGGTLVLINGRRVAPNAFAGDEVDLNLIPLGAIDRIEILVDGASATYGTDAIAGVVNIITKREFNGVEIYGYYGNTTDTDVGRQEYYFNAGVVDEKGSFMIGGNYIEQNALYSQDRSRSFVDVNNRTQSYLDNVNTATSNPGRFGVRNDARGGGGLYDPNLAADTPVQVSLNKGAVPNTLGRYSPTDYHVSDVLIGDISESVADPSLEYYPFDKFPFPIYTPAIRPAERYSIYGSGTYNIYEESLEFFTDVLFSHSETFNQLAPTPISNGTVGYPIPASNYYNPFGVDIDSWAYRSVEFGARTDAIDYDAFRFVVGLRGQIPDSSWGWEVGMLWSETSADEFLGGDLSRRSLEQAINDPTPAAFNPFGFQANNAEQIARVRQSEIILGQSTLWSVDGRVAGELFELPAAPVALAVGGEYREERGESVPDGPTQSADTVGYNSQTALFGQRDVSAVFGELYVPVFSEKNELPGLYTFNIRAAFRYEDYSDFGSTVKPSVKFGWLPIDETWTLYGSWSQSFKAPNYVDLYAVSQQDFPDIRNPYTGDFTQISTFNQGNPFLEPEESNNFLIGTEYRPKWLPGLKVQVDYFRMELTDVPGGSAQFIVDENAQTGGPSNAVPNPNFDPNAPVAAGNYPLMEGVNPNPGQYSELFVFDPVNNLYDQIDVPTLNLSAINLDGIDFYVSYEWDTESWGNWLFEVNGTYLLTFEEENTPGSGFVDRLGDFSNDDFGFGSLPRLKGYASAFWSYDKFQIGAYANYIDHYLDDKLAGVDRDIDEFLTFDLQASYVFPHDIKLTGGCLNVTDAEVPLAVGAFADQYDRDIHDIRQRFWYVSLQKRF